MKKVVIVEPEYPENTGFIARLASNFDYELRLVNPCFNISEARDTAKNCQDKLRGARIFDTVEEAVKDIDYIMGTKPKKGKALKKFTPRENTSIMIGRESSGLTSKELELCDCTVHIKAESYSSLNQSHAAGILMHSVSSRAKSTGIEQSQKELLRDKLSEPVYRAVINGNPSKERAGRILGELT